MTIGELAKASGLASSAIRYYESLGLIRSERSEGGQRRYDEDAPLTLRQLTFAKSAGFTLREMTDLLTPLESGQPLFAAWQALAQRKLVELDAVIAQAQEMKQRLQHALACRCTNVDECGLLNEDGVAGIS